MAHPTSQPTNQSPQVHDEHILVVKRNILLKKPWHGLRREYTADCVHLIMEHQEFLPRSAMEQDPNYKQIIPYIVFTYAGQYFAMQRRSDASEKRLQNKYTLGIGGHIRKEDMTSTDITDWAQREFHEEVAYTGSLRWQFLGLLNDDTNPVGQVHLGLVLLAHGSSSDISIKSELKSGTLITLQECIETAPTMETWSQFIVDYLKDRP